MKTAENKGASIGRILPLHSLQQLRTYTAELHVVDLVHLEKNFM